MVEPKTGSWRDWSQYVLVTLKELHAEVADLKREVYLMKGRSHVWAVIGGAIAAGIVSVVVHLLLNS